MRIVTYKAKALETGRSNGRVIHPGDWVCGTLEQWGRRAVIKEQNLMPGYFIVDEETVCQSTGVYDANGKMIYESDALFDDGHIYIVEWEEENARFVLVSEAITLSFADIDSEWYEIVGNIHDKE